MSSENSKRKFNDDLKSKIIEDHSHIAWDRRSDSVFQSQTEGNGLSSAHELYVLIANEISQLIKILLHLNYPDG